MGRTQDRVGFTDPLQRVVLVEKDLDENDTAVDKLVKSVNRLTLILAGAVISFASSAVLLAWQLALTHPGK